MFKMFVSLLALASSAMAESQQYYENSIPAQTRLNERLLMMQSDAAAAAPVYDGGYYGEPVAGPAYLQEEYFNQGMKPQNIVIMTSIVWLLLGIFFGAGIWYCWSKSLFGLNSTKTTTTTV